MAGLALVVRFVFADIELRHLHRPLFLEAPALMAQRRRQNRARILFQLYVAGLRVKVVRPGCPRLHLIPFTKLFTADRRRLVKPDAGRL